MPVISQPTAISFPAQEIQAFCQRWQISELALFGSVLRPDFAPGSDVDVLVTFDPQAQHSLTDFVQAQLELEDLLQRPVDLVEKDSVTNPIRRKAILDSYQVLYAAE